jgi:hypothetical protein
MTQLQPYFDVQAAPGLEVGQAILYGMRRSADDPATASASVSASAPPDAAELALSSDYRARTRVETDTSAVDVQRHALAYTVAGELAQALDCDTLIGLGTEDVAGFATSAGAYASHRVRVARSGGDRRTPTRPCSGSKPISTRWRPCCCRTPC